MPSHEPAEYECPFCGFLAGRFTEYNDQEDMICQNKLASAFVGPIAWQNNIGSVLVVPNTHYENIYSIPEDDLVAITKLVKSVATAMRIAYGCQGTTILQRNEPAAGQHVWHLHFHVIPRYSGDEFKENEQTLFVEAGVRAPFAQKLRGQLNLSA